ncbi:MAG: hypothetical protein D8M59_01605 [Planctomycetes bacterium]|nr:hypothetical protein [Planctomycetota bacterium]NOG54582.1 hypothetical protein [Planctomycetota bacterium]
MSAFDSSSFRIGKATGACAATGRPIEPGQAYIATLCEQEESDDFARLDYHIEPWESGQRPDRLYSYWRAVMPDANAPKNALVDDAVLQALFERLGEDDDRPQRAAYRYVIGLILMRKRLLKHVGMKRDDDGRSVWLVVPKGSPPEEEPIEMVDPQLSEDQQRDVADQLGEVLRSEL